MLTSLSNVRISLFLLLRLIAELGDDIPSNCFVVMEGFGRDGSCFQTQVGETECFGDGRSGATEIRITDNDRKNI